jgi:SOS response associated peptidase (SRAP)
VHQGRVPQAGAAERRHVNLLLWQNTQDGKQPWYFTARDGSLALTVAGLWDEWKDRQTGEQLKSCTMIITEPSAFVAEVHDRMPALLAEQDFEPWLCGEAGIELLKHAADDLLQRWPVSKRVNSSKAPADDPTLIDRVDLNILPPKTSSFTIIPPKKEWKGSFAAPRPAHPASRSR